MRTRLIIAVAAVLLAVPMTAAAAIAPAAAGGRQSRTSDTAVAGADVYLTSAHSHSLRGGACSLSYVVQRTDGRSAVLTAGHCVATLPGGPSYEVYQTRAAAHDHTDPGDRLGSVTRGRFHVGKYGDNALIGLAHGSNSLPEIFTGGPKSTTTEAVTGGASPKVGEKHVCYSGARSGEHCGFRIIRAGRTIGFPESGRIYKIHHEWTATGGCHAAAGDSGAPVFVRHGSGVRAVGILSGGGHGGGRCVIYFTPLSLALRSLHASLLVS